MLRSPVTAVLLTTGLLLVGCGSGDSASTSSASAAPESVTTTPAAVAAGLGKIVTIAADVKANISEKGKATMIDKGIEPIWATVEGTVKGNDADAYLAFEDAFAVLENAAKDGDAAKAAAGSDAVSKAASAYLAKYPA
jgi:hypothetical protein